MAISLVLIGLIGSAAAVYFYKDIEGLFTRVQVNLSAPVGQTMNVLILGSDARDGLDTAADRTRFGPVGGKRADTIIVAQINPSERRAVLLHFPRDLWVDIAGRSGKAKINSSYGGGPQQVIDTVNQLTGIPINHYMEINISGFRKMVDAIGGIDICSSQKLYDSKLNFKLPAGHNHLDGEASLSFVRARHATTDGDFGRINRQQQFLKAVVQKVGQPSTLGNPVKLDSLARAFAENVTVDPNFNLSDMLRLAASIKRVGVDQIATYTVPGADGRAGSQSVVNMDQRPAELLFQALRENKDPAKALAPHIAVEDASGSGVLESVSTELQNRGFVITRKETVAVQPKTTVVAPRGMNAEAQVVADAVGARRVTGGQEITLVLGSGFVSLPAVAPPQTPGPAIGPCSP